MAENNISNEFTLDNCTRIMLELAEGKYSDCSFVVGYGDEIEVVQGMKKDVVKNSDFMASLFRNPLCDPELIRIPNIDIATYKHINNYLHLDKHLPGTLSCSEAVSLAEAADSLILKPIGYVEEHCFKIIKAKMGARHVWKLLDKQFASNLNQITDFCLTLIRNKTTACIIHESFLDASFESVNKMLQQDTLMLTEGQLLYFLLLWASLQPEGLSLAMRGLLPNLRLCALKPSELSRLSEFLDATEIAAVESFVMKSCSDDFHLPQTLCQTTEARIPFRYEMTCVFITPSMLQLSNVAREDISIFCNFNKQDAYNQIDNYITISCFKDTYVTKISGIAPVDVISHREISDSPDGQRESYDVLFADQKVGSFRADQEMWEVRLPEPLYIKKSAEKYYVHVGVRFKPNQRFIRRFTETRVNNELNESEHLEAIDNIACTPRGKIDILHGLRHHLHLSNFDGRKCPDFVFVHSLSYCILENQEH